MLEKKMHKSENMLQKGARMGAEIDQNIDKNGGSKKVWIFSPLAAHKTLAPGSTVAILGGPF